MRGEQLVQLACQLRVRAGMVDVDESGFRSELRLAQGTALDVPLRNDGGAYLKKNRTSGRAPRRW